MAYLSFWLWLEKYLVTMGPYFGALIPSNIIPWLLTHLHIDINDSILDGENISHAMCWLDEFETINKPKPSCRFHRWYHSRRFHRRYRGFILVGGISDKSLFEINSTTKVCSSWMLMRMDPLLKLLSKTWLAFFLLSDKMKMTIRKAGNLQKPPPRHAI